MTWAARRKLQYLSIVFGIIFIILVYLLYPIIVKSPTCSDGKKNGDEIGVDCGGSCMRMCKEKISDPLILWSRAFHVTGHNYNLVAFVENQNRDSATQNTQYEFTIYDTNNKMIGRRVGSTYIPPNKQFAIFESRFDSGETNVRSVAFRFVGDFDWVKKEPTLNTLPIYVDKILIGTDLKNPSLSARVRNESVYDIPKFSVTTILYDKDHNAINVSKTFKDFLKSNENTEVFFTWPEALSGDPVIKDLLVDINPFTVSF